jgi:hypothetical protein
MTNKEMARKIGEEIIRLRSRIDALEGVMLEYRVMDSGHPAKEIPWRRDLVRVEAEPSHQQLILERSERLQAALHDEVPESALIQVLWRNYCQK